MRNTVQNVFVLLLGVLSVNLSGCNIFSAAGVMAHNIEREKKIEVLAQYDGLRDETVAVVVQADHLTLYEHPQVVANICLNVLRLSAPARPSLLLEVQVGEGGSGHALVGVPGEAQRLLVGGAGEH